MQNLIIFVLQSKPTIFKDILLIFVLQSQAASCFQEEDIIRSYATRSEFYAIFNSSFQLHFLIVW